MTEKVKVKFLKDYKGGPKPENCPKKGDIVYIKKNDEGLKYFLEQKIVEVLETTNQIDKTTEVTKESTEGTPIDPEIGQKLKEKDEKSDDTTDLNSESKETETLVKNSTEKKGKQHDPIEEDRKKYEVTREDVDKLNKDLDIIETKKEEAIQGITLEWIKHNIRKWVWAYYNKGCNLLPIKYKTKVPNGLSKGEIKKWQYNRQPKELIQKWLDAGLFEGVAILGGKVSGNLICLDFDDPEYFTILGLTTDGLLKDGAWVTETPRERGRYHVVIRDKNEVKVTRKQRFIDYRANEHYWLVYPSIHPDKGKQYNFLNTHNPNDLELPAIRDTLAMFEVWSNKISEIKGTKDKISKTVKTKKEFDTSADCIRNAWKMGAPPGERYYIAIALASWLQQRDFPEEMATELVVNWFLTKCNTEGRDVEDIKGAVATAYTKVKDEDGELKTYETGCNFWREKTTFCPYPDKKDCPYKPAEIKGKKELLEKYGVFETKEDKKTGEAIRTGKINCVRLAELILNEHGYYFFTMRDNKGIFFYNGGYYEPNADTIIANLTEYYLDDYSKEYMKNECTGHIRDKHYVDRETINPPINFINFKNGVYDIKTKKLLPHSPKYMFLNEIPTRYDPDAKCPLFEKYLQEVCMKQKKRREDIEKTVQEYMGYTFYQSYRFKRYIVLDGSGDNGKTQLLLVVERLIGKRNNASISLQDLNNRPFTLSKLHRKLANISDDLPNKPLKYSGIIKQITGNSPMWADIKGHKDGIRFTNTAKPWFACNQLPETTDFGDAFFSRMLQITFLNKFVKPVDYDKVDNETVFKADLDLTDGKEKLFDELPGILNFALNGLHRLLENDGFSFTQSTDEIRDEYIKKTNPIRAYINDECERTNEDWGITKDDFYNAVLQYCERQGYDKPNSQHDVTKRVNDEPGNIYLKQRTVDGERERVWLGVRSLTDSTINQYFREDEEIKKQEEESQKTLDKKDGGQDDKQDDEPIFTESEEIDVKQIIQNNPDVNYSLLVSKFGEHKIHKAIDADLLIELTLGIKLGLGSLK